MSAKVWSVSTGSAYVQVKATSSYSHSNRSIRSVKMTEGNPRTIMKTLFVEMGVGYDQHGQDITKAAMRACRDAIQANSIPAFRSGLLPGVNSKDMKLKLKLGVPKNVQESLDIEKVKSIFPYGEIIDVEIVDGGLICSSGTKIEEMGDQSDDCYVVNAAVYVGY